MNINSIQTVQIMQNAIKSADRGDGASTGTESSAAPENTGSQPSGAAIVAGVGFLKDQLNELLTSYPPFFPVGSYQRSDLIKKISTLEEKIGKSTVDESIRKMFDREKLSSTATDTEISASLDRLTAAADRLGERQSVKQEPIKPGAFISVKV